MTINYDGAWTSQATHQKHYDILKYPETIDVRDGLLRVAGNKKLFDKLLWRLVDDLPNLLNELTTALAENNFEAIKQVAHSLKGASANLAILDIAEKSAQLEHHAHTKDIKKSSTSFDELSVTIALFVAAMNNYSR